VNEKSTVETAAKKAVDNLNDLMREYIALESQIGMLTLLGAIFVVIAFFYHILIIFIVLIIGLIFLWVSKTYKVASEIEVLRKKIWMLSKSLENEKESKKTDPS
jgi:cell division protein FtsL